MSVRPHYYPWVTPHSAIKRAYLGEYDSWIEANDALVAYVRNRGTYVSPKTVRRLAH